MELTGLLQMAPFRGMKEEELVAFLFGLPNSLKHFCIGENFKTNTGKRIAYNRVILD